MEICDICGETLANHAGQRDKKELVRIRSNFLYHRLDEVFHEECWDGEKENYEYVATH